MIKNLLIARKTCRPGEGVDMYYLKKRLYIFERPVSTGSRQYLNARKIFKRRNINWKKYRNGEKRRKKP